MTHDTNEIYILLHILCYKMLYSTLELNTTLKRNFVTTFICHRTSVYFVGQSSDVIFRSDNKKDLITYKY